MSSITKEWTEADFRKELRKLDLKIREEQGITLSGSNLRVAAAFGCKTPRNSVQILTSSRLRSILKVYNYS